MRPHTSFLVCCNPRTGSWLLAEALEGTGIAGRPKEYFAPECEQEWFERLGVSTYTDYLSKVIEAGTTPNGIFGAKVHWYQFKDWSSKLRQLPGSEEMTTPDLMSRLFPNLHYLWLTRSDKVRQAVSYLRAIQTGKWWKIDGWEHIGNNTQTFDFERIDRLQSLICANEAAWQEYFRECGVEPFIVTYEELAEDYQTTIQRVLESLHLPLIPDIQIAKTRLKKQADSKSEEWVQRYYKMKEAR